MDSEKKSTSPRFTPNIPAPVTPTRKPVTQFPQGSCDCHAHVFGPPEWDRLLPNTHFLPNECPLPEYLKMLGTLGVERAVLVQPSVYGTDNSLLAEALADQSFQLRGVAVVSPDITTKELEAMHALGFRGVRVNTASATPGLTLSDASLLAEKISVLGWHLQFFVNLETSPQIEDFIAGLKINVVIDHFGLVQANGGTQSPAARTLLRLLSHEHCWAKLIGPYFISSDFPAHRDVDALAQAMYKTAPHRLIWGTDWPHPSARAQMPDDGNLADMLARWLPDEAARRQVLVDNPARLYGFDR